MWCILKKALSGKGCIDMERRTLWRQKVITRVEESLNPKQLEMNKCIYTFPQTAAPGANSFTSSGAVKRVRHRK